MGPYPPPDLDQNLFLRYAPISGAFGIHFGAEVAQHDERFDVAGVFEGDAGFGGGFGAEDFVLGQFVEADQLRAIEVRACSSCLCPGR